MTAKLYFICLAMFVLGQLLQLFWVKIPSLRKRFKAANATFIFKEYWSNDWHLIIGTFVLGVMGILGLNELIHWKPAILEYVKWFFGAIGYFAQSVVMSKLSSYETKLNNVIDAKTDKADGKF